MKIEIWSDVICPFCYIGKRHLEQALNQLNLKETVEIEWKSFLLNPDMPDIVNSSSVYAYLAEAKGISIDQSREMHQNVAKMAAQSGLTYDFDNAIMANSKKAHQLIQLAKESNCDDQVEEALFKAYFCDGKDISNLDLLISIADKIGLNREETEAALKNNSFSNAIQRDIDEASRIGVRGVPFFVFDSKYAISGAQPVEAFVQTLEKVVEESLS